MMLTVGDLIKKLQKLPQDLLVVSGTYEAVPIVDVRVVSINDGHFLHDHPEREDAKVVGFDEGSWE